MPRRFRSANTAGEHPARSWMKFFRGKPMAKMLEETRQQPQALTTTLESGMRAILDLRRHFEQHRPRLIVMAARGTSDNAAQFGRYLIEITTRIPVSLAAPSILT